MKLRLGSACLAGVALLLLPAVGCTRKPAPAPAQSPSATASPSPNRLPAPAAPPRERPRGGWAPPAGLLSRLGGSVTFDAYQLRPPKGFEEVNQPEEAGARGVAWIGAARRDGTRPSLLLVLAADPSGAGGAFAPEIALARFLANARRGRTGWRQSTLERGRVGGILFARSRWSGVDPSRRRRLHGFSYVSVAEDGSVLQLASQEFEPHHRSSLRIAEAAALTVRSRE